MLFKDLNLNSQHCSGSSDFDIIFNYFLFPQWEFATLQYSPTPIHLPKHIKQIKTIILM
jgi:hypothetical protein